ncbi:aldose epimerase family protein [Sansalvadorimonas verongulae]|uniref:aldose epimerase family protein n=1 Tax=Sansalvadorimonas verongulae TaxID=2172824 RepID=UPI0012BBC82E|nr:aldose epimerase family protein [Sansalvadorimonas verongulae]MTI15204.1 galactose mutarotase [Sansalvadorimonas verongulae]
MVTVSQKAFGCTRSGESVSQIALCNGQGTEVVLINYGATIQSIRTKDRSGHFANIVLGCDGLTDYEQQSACLGAVAGPCANRIAHGRFELNGDTVQLTQNHDKHHLHGGAKGYQRTIWQFDTEQSDGCASVIMSCTTADGEEGYPGNVTSIVTYTLNDDNSLDIRYSATTDKTTVVNITQHSYFNLSGQPQTDCLNHSLQLNAEHYLATDAESIPTGELVAVEGTPFDFRHPKTIGQDIHTDHRELTKCRGFDHNYCLTPNPDQELHDVGEVYEPESGRTMKVETNQPGIQLYTGNFLQGTPATQGRKWENHSGFCLESQAWPDAPNQPGFPSITLKPDAKYHHHTRWTFGIKD